MHIEIPVTIVDNGYNEVMRFIDKNLNLVDHEGNGFKFNPIQRRLIKNYCKYDKNSVLKARQVGFTTTLIAYTFYLLTNKPDTRILYNIPSHAMSRNIYHRFMSFNTNFDLDFNNSGRKIKYEPINSSCSIKNVSSQHDLMGEKFDYVFMDEVSSITNWEMVLSYLQPDQIVLGGTPSSSSDNSFKRHFDYITEDNGREVDEFVMSFYEDEEGDKKVTKYKHEGKNGYYPSRIPMDYFSDSTLSI